jgi:hypothetical protein
MRQRSILGLVTGCLGVVLLASCSSNTELTEDGEQVRLLTGRVPAACTNLGPVDASPYLATAQPQINLRNNAGALGANPVIVVRAVPEVQGVRYYGIAFVCPEFMLPSKQT